MERAVKVSESAYGKEHKKVTTTRLQTQYRFNEEIMKWPNENIYDGTLIAGEANKDLKHNNLPAISIFDIESKELFGGHGCNYRNEKEAEFLLAYLYRLM